MILGAHRSLGLAPSLKGSGSVQTIGKIWSLTPVLEKSLCMMSDHEVVKSVADDVMSSLRLEGKAFGLCPLEACVELKLSYETKL